MWCAKEAGYFSRTARNIKNGYSIWKIPDRLRLHALKENPPFFARNQDFSALARMSAAWLSVRKVHERGPPAFMILFFDTFTLQKRWVRGHHKSLYFYIEAVNPGVLFLSVVISVIAFQKVENIGDIAFEINSHKKNVPFVDKKPNFVNYLPRRLIAKKAKNFTSTSIEAVIFSRNMSKYSMNCETCSQIIQ